ncbi:hypothetical protein P7D85_13865 [Enterococcus hulanensis]|uniref:Uncharacterized protein n=1 Tax=Enterococcus hulanensis TaxID=2559929 RepID=A0ABU3F170_9ENTE|nr:hypothetical protein [Enterococcus hulanensis]MDT2600867.1 hypothetical protein [Enterococcus hulanensis]MDT2611455.1 hypothetical protein [Enterococcus hulanensis]MDT2618060.1 hypothetical protein [Enterococcus hulanensis]MDT2629063.1 hypothetical protein [Enterococcus hulanensis]MDT2656625.1 hypothetical protein [Enterococcus hulanensis]
MEAVKLGQRQVFLMKKESLTKRVQMFYEQTKNIEQLIQYMVAILVRNALSQGIFTEQLKELVREIYLTSEPNDTLRQYSPFFKHCFSGGEWKELIKKMFKNESTYFASTKEARFYNNYLGKDGTLNNRREGLVYHVESVFEDAAGKKHKLTIPDTDPTKNEEQTENILRTLSILTVFENAGVRKFVEYVSYKTPGMTIASAHNSRKEQKAAAAEATDDTEKSTPQQENPQKQSVHSTSVKNETGQILSTDRKSGDDKALIEELSPTERLGNRAPSAKKAEKAETSSKNESASPVNPPTSGKSKDEAKAQPAAKKKSNKPLDLPKKPDTSHMRYGKSEAQIEKERENRRLQREAAKQSGKKKKKKKRK